MNEIRFPILTLLTTNQAQSLDFIKKFFFFISSDLINSTPLNSIGIPYAERKGKGKAKGIGDFIHLQISGCITRG